MTSRSPHRDFPRVLEIVLQHILPRQVVQSWLFKLHSPNYTQLTTLTVRSLVKLHRSATANRMTIPLVNALYMDLLRSLCCAQLVQILGEYNVIEM